MKSLNNHYIAGFVDGEGCFALNYRTDKRYNSDGNKIYEYHYWTTEFAIVLHPLDADLLGLIKDSLGIGNISFKRAGDQVRYSVQNTAELNNIIVPFFISLLTTFVIYGGYTLYAQDDYSDDNFRDATDFYTAFNAYHGEMSDFFNKKIKQFNMLMLDGNGDDDEAFYQNPEKKQKFLPPSNISDKDDLEAIVTKCGDENVSTYCVSMGALYKYLDYLKVLDRI